MSFFKSFFAALLALLVFSIVIVVVLVAIVGKAASEKEVVLNDNSVLHLKLDGEITELQKDNFLEGLPFPGSDQNKVGLIQLKQAIKYAEKDDKIKGIYLEASYPQTGFSTLEEIRQSLIDFQKSGKWVVAYNEVLSEGAYYLSTAAKDIYLNPEGDIELNGLSIQISFFKRLFDKLEIKPQIFRVGEFKSAVEPFMLEEMSTENELQLTAMATSIYDFMLQRMSESRNIPKDKLKEIANKMLVRNAQAAKDLGLVNELFFEDEFLDNLRNRLGLKKDEDVKFVTYDKYRKSFSNYPKSDNEIAVIVAEGTIMPGKAEDQDGVVGAESFIKELRKARKSSNVKAIVIRINSPGGEFRASDMMWREIQLAKKEKPVIASMSDYAASGGYYMAMGCDTIVAQPHTITGSIGIFGIMFDMSGFLGNKLGITFDEVKTGEFGEMFTVTRPLTEVEKNYWQRNLNDHYATFVGKAAEGRNISVEKIKEVASGRVWTGAQANERNLVDVQGGFDDAVKIAAAKAGVKDDYKIRYYPKPKTFFEQWFSNIEEDTKINTIKSELGEYYPWYQQLQKVKTYQGEQARMPFELKIQ